MFLKMKYYRLFYMMNANKWKCTTSIPYIELRIKDNLNILLKNICRKMDVYTVQVYT